MFIIKSDLLIKYIKIVLIKLTISLVKNYKQKFSYKKYIRSVSKLISQYSVNLFNPNGTVEYYESEL